MGVVNKPMTVWNTSYIPSPLHGFNDGPDSTPGISNLISLAIVVNRFLVTTTRNARSLSLALTLLRHLGSTGNSRNKHTVGTRGDMLILNICLCSDRLANRALFTVRLTEPPIWHRLSLARPIHQYC